MRLTKNRYIAAFCLLVLYLIFQISTTAFPHVHVIGGEKVVHSHPSSSPNHTHSATQAFVIARLSSIQTIEAELPSLVCMLFPVFHTLIVAKDSFCQKESHSHCLYLRAPPCC